MLNQIKTVRLGMHKQHFFAELRAKALFSAQGTVAGKTVRNVILKHEVLEDDFEPVGDDEPLPFD